MSVTRYMQASANWVLLGELDKFVPLASERFSEVQISPSGPEATLFGKPDEVVHVTALQFTDSVWYVVVADVQIGADGTGPLRF
jgi:hypothetical protein